MKDFPLKKKLKEKKNRVRVRKMNLLDVALRKIESVQSPKISLKLKDFPPKKKNLKDKKKKKIRVRVKKTNLVDVALREIEAVRCGPKSI